MIMVSVWWIKKGILHFEILLRNRTINSNLYVQQLAKLSDAVEEKRPELSYRKVVVIQDDNAKPHTSLVIRQETLELVWDVLSSPKYSPDLAPSDYHLFRSVQNSLNGKIFNDADDVKSHLIRFLLEKLEVLWTRNYASAWKMVKGHRQKGTIPNWIKMYFWIKKIEFFFFFKSAIT